MPMTEAAIDTGLLRDVYVSLGEPIDERRLERARVLQALRRLDLGRLPADGAGRPVAISDRRYRLKRRAAGQLRLAPGYSATA
jgi:cytochrome c-type biogenesis protein CcmF